MLENPCFIISLQTGAKVIAALDILLAAVPLAIILSGVIPGYHESRNIVETIERTVTDDVESATSRTGTNFTIVNVIVKEHHTYFDMGLWTIMIFFVVVDIAVSYILYTGSKSRHLKKLKTWFYIRAITLVVTTITLISSICLGISFRIVVYDCFHTIYRIYTLWVIHALIQDILIENRRLQNATYYAKAVGTPPAIIVTSATENDINGMNGTNNRSNGNSKFAFDNIAFT